MREDLTKAEPLRILLIDDNPDDRALVERELKLRIPALEVRHISEAATLAAAIDSGWHDVAITDYRLRWTTGADVLREMKARHPDKPVIMFTGSGNEEVAVDAMKDGLDDYITKTPKHYPRVPFAVLASHERSSVRTRLKKQQEELQTMLEVLPVGIAISHDPAVRHITTTPWFAELMGIPPDTDIGDGAGCSYFRAGQPVASEDWPMRVAARTGRLVRGDEIEVRFADGRALTVLVNAAPLLDDHGQVRGAVAALVDVSALKATQRELEESNRQKSEFLSVLAHELRNPMAAIGYSVELLRHVGSPQAVGKARDVIARQSAHMGRLLDDLLDLSRITHKRIDLALHPIDMRRVIELAFESTRTLIDANGHTLNFDLPPEPTMVMGDEVRLTQVISNLLNNAAKFTQPGGIISVRVARARASVVLTVADNGPGIEPSQLEYVFGMFAQGQSKVSGGSSGLGIGLAVVRRLVDLHGGKVEAFSEGCGRGTTLRVELPAIEAQEAPAEACETEDAAGHIQLLVADDNVDAADLLADVLRMEGYAVQVAYDGRAAIESADRLHPQALILDIGMPHANGLEVARWVRAQDWGERATLIAVTGWGQEKDRSATAEAGFDVHLVKPVSPIEIVRTIGLHLKP